MVIWRGWGFLVLFFVIFAITWGWQWYPALFKTVSGYEYATSAEQQIGWGIGWLITALLLFLFNQFLLLRLERVPSSGEQMQARLEAKKAAEARGETFVVPAHTKPYSSFFFIPLRVIPIILGAIGLLMIGFGIGPAIEQRAEQVRIEQEIQQIEQELEEDLAELDGN